MMKKPLQYIIIDDDQTNNLICSHVIKKFNSNAQVLLFQDPEEALESFLNKNEEKLIGKKQTVVFLDLNMPSISGWEFLEALEKNKPEILSHVEIYILSSSIEDFSEQLKRYPYLAGFLSKPLTKHNLQEIALTKGNSFRGFN
ncbi:response regulator [Gramella sp. KN1008]|uniref:response regulator n=1 Tax=Gramella sp. KN1008 TaxID=2529298 RepID=UPI00103C7404|nr:response regulator [Gramella sp. KN1008]TBW29273.1 response regulator [Gramella sp. KN1008]